ncbi:MAG: WG repeat-containing protein, partial [Eubacteriales bacterium]
DGEYVVPLQYEWYPISVFSNGIAKVKDRETGKVQYINKSGDIIYTE